MPAKRIPTAIHQMKGSFEKNPSRGRARADEPKPDGPLGAPPADFLNKFLGQMGCNPADRSRVAAKKAKDADRRTPDEWGNLAAERLPQPPAVQ